MKKISIQPYSYNGYNAGSKAVNDTSEILRKNGYQIYSISCCQRYFGNFFHLLGLYLDIIRFYCLLFRLGNDDVVFIQWPFYSEDCFSRSLSKYLYKKRINTIILIHDINNLRDANEKIDESFVKILQFASNIIVHSGEMKKYICSLGANKNAISILTTFDYLTDDIISIRKMSKTVVYAGNLDKSAFINSIDKSLLDKVTINCYGKGNVKVKNGLVYKGYFKPNEVSKIEGSWGLVWDGDSTDTCTGLYGEYLRFNSPHKVSMYIVACLPIIIWKYSALASYVEDKQIGFTIESLDEIPHILDTISDELYSMYSTNIQEEAKNLRKGKHLLDVLGITSHD